MTVQAEFLSVVDTAAVLGISDDLVYQLIASGEIPAAMFGRRKLVPRRAVDLVIERTMDGFDPTALLARLAAAGSSPASDPAGALEESTGTAESETPTHSTAAASGQQVAATAASVLPLRRSS